jgi:hypothetical protein
MLAMVTSVHYHSQNAPRGHGMPIGLMRVAAATLLLLCFAKEAPVADAKARDAAVDFGPSRRYPSRDEMSDPAARSPSGTLSSQWRVVVEGDAANRERARRHGYYQAKP